MTLKPSSLVATLIASAALIACASPQYSSAPVTSYPASAPQQSSQYGVVDSIRAVQETGSNGVAGSVIGGVVGGLLGNQVGGGSGRTVATVAGAVGGAVVGNQVERRNSTPKQAYQIGVRMDNGSYHTLTQDSAADLRVGSRVRIEGGRAYRY